MKPHSRGTSTSSYNHNHSHNQHALQSKYQFSSNSWRELKYFQIFNLHQDETFQNLMVSYYNVILSSIMDDGISNSSSNGSNNSRNSNSSSSSSDKSKNSIDEESQISDKMTSFIDSKYDLRIFANSLVSYEEVKEAYINLSDPIKRKYYWIKGSPLSEHTGITTNHNSTIPSSSSSPLSILVHSNEQVNKIVNSNNSNNNTPTTSSNGLSNIQPPLSLFSLLNGNNSSNINNTATMGSGMKTTLPFVNNNNPPSGPGQCSQPTVDQVITPKNTNKPTIQLLLNWKCSSNVQEYSLMMKSPTKPEFHVIYRGHNNFFTTPPLELGIYNFKVRATNRFGVGEFSKELEYLIKYNEQNNNIVNNNNNTTTDNSNNNNNTNLDNTNTNNISSHSNNKKPNNNNNNNHQNTSQNKSMEEQKIKQRDEILNEINHFLNQNCKVIVQNSMNQCDEMLNQLVNLQTKFLKFTGLPISTSTSINQDEVIAKLETTIETLRQLLASFKLIREWKILLKNSLSEFIHNSSSNDNEQLEKIRNLISSLSNDIPEQVKIMIFQTIIQFTKKKLTESSTTRSRTAILLTIFARNSEFFGENWCNEMETLAKSLFESKKKKKPNSNQNISNSNHNNSNNNNSNKKQKNQPSTSPLPKTTKLQINTTPQITMSQLQQQQQRQQQELQLQQQQQELLQQQQQQNILKEDVINSQKQKQSFSDFITTQNNNNTNNIIIYNNNNNTNNYQIDKNININYKKSSNIQINGTSIKSSTDEIIHDFKVPSSPPIGSNLIVSPPKSTYSNFNTINNNGNNFYPIPFQGFLTPVLSNLHQNVNLSNTNNNKNTPNSPTPLNSVNINNNDNHQQKHNQNVFNSYNFSQSNQSLFFNQPFKSNNNNDSGSGGNQFGENLYSSQDDFFRQLMDNNHMITTSTTTTTTTTTTVGKQSPPPIGLPTNPFQHPQQQQQETLIPLPSQDNTHSFSFYHIVPNQINSESLNF